MRRFGIAALWCMGLWRASGAVATSRFSLGRLECQLEVQYGRDFPVHLRAAWCEPDAGDGRDFPFAQLRFGEGCLSRLKR